MGSKGIVLLKARQTGATTALHKLWEPLGVSRLIPPYVIGDGRNFSDVKIFVDRTNHQTGDYLTTPGAQSLLVQNVEEVEDFFESYAVITVKLLTNDATQVIDPELIKQKILGSTGFGIWQQMNKANVHAYDRTKVIQQLPQFLKDLQNVKLNNTPKRKRKAKRKSSDDTVFQPRVSMGNHFQPPRFNPKVKSGTRRSRRRG